MKTLFRIFALTVFTLSILPMSIFAQGSLTPPGAPAPNYVIAAGNSFGPIVNVQGVGDITGTANANHPWANFSY